MTPLAFPLGPIELIILTIIVIPVIAGVIILIVALSRKNTPPPRPDYPTPGQQPPPGR